MSLRPSEATLLAKELERELGGAVVQQVSSPGPARVYLELRVPGASVTLLVCAEQKAARLSVVEKRPPNPATPPAWQSVLRRELVGAKLLDAESVESRRLVVLHFDRGSVVLEYGAEPQLALTTKEGRVLAVSVPAREGLRPGASWQPPPEAPPGQAPSRLAGDFTRCRLLRAAEALIGQQESTRWLEARLAPVRARLKKLERTRLKVKEESERTPLAERHRAEGELLARNQHLLTRGEKQIVLTEYLETGPVERTIALDPARTPRQEVDWRFHQYRRLLRGVEFARKRLLQLEEERVRLEAELARLSTEAPVAPIVNARAKKGPAVAKPPYREYTGHGGQPIWVGRGAAHNDALTFQVARPWHVWFHARGVPGAHVVVPLPRNAQLTPEVLLDAAHLALHHSDSKGEPRGEVSYVAAKRVRKPRDAAPGAVLYTGERTLMLRVEPQRLSRLLASETDGVD